MPYRPSPWKRLYSLARWRKIRAQQLASEPLCRFCKRNGRLTPATVCDHVDPHRGDLAKFWRGPFQSLCKTCHDSTKQTMEKSGRQLVRIGLDGWPIEEGK